MKGKIIIIHSVFFSLFLILTVAVPYGLAIEDPVEDALLNGNWEEVIELLKKDDSKANDPVARLIMGHACLATNRNNESLLLFLSVKEQDALRLWSEWTDLLLRRHSSNPIALYLSGDAKARTGKLKEAEEMFTRTLKVKGDFAFAYNLRGIIYALTGETAKAIEDFNVAIKLNPSLTDAYYNKGLLYSHVGEYQKALEDYTKAIHINPSALPYNGRAVVYWQLGMYDLALNELEVAKSLYLIFQPLTAISPLFAVRRPRVPLSLSLLQGKK